MQVRCDDGIGTGYVKVERRLCKAFVELECEHALAGSGDLGDLLGAGQDRAELVGLDQIILRKGCTC